MNANEVYQNDYSNGTAGRIVIFEQIDTMTTVILAIGMASFIILLMFGTCFVARSCARYCVKRWCPSLARIKIEPGEI
jgi:hypothetical protein